MPSRAVEPKSRTAIKRQPPLAMLSNGSRGNSLQAENVILGIIRRTRSTSVQKHLLEVTRSKLNKSDRAEQYCVTAFSIDGAAKD